MSLNLGNTKIKDIYLGGTKIKEAYLGSTKVYGNLPVYKDRYEYTIFKSSNGLGVSSGTCNSNINSYDQIGILLVNISRSVGGGEWLWFDKDGTAASSGSHYIKYNTNDGTYFQTFQLVFNWNGATFSISHSNNNGWDLYTKMSDTTRIYVNNPSDMNKAVAQIVGVKYQ